MGKMLFHYCSLQSFESIIKNHTLRFADITKSNDSEELLFITTFYKQSVNIDPKNEWAPERYLLKGTLKDCTYYAFCLSDKEDDLSQWRGYAPNGGFAIGFDEVELKQLIEEQVVIKNDEERDRELLSKNNSSATVEIGTNKETHGTFCRVKYPRLPNEGLDNADSLELQKKMKQLSDAFWKKHESGEATPLPIQKLMESCFEYKGKGFEEESEYRMIFSRGKSSLANEDVEDVVCVRGETVKKNGDYYDIPFDLSMIKKIIIGPKISFLGQKSGFTKMVWDFLKENDTYCGEDDNHNLAITEDDIVLTKLTFR